MKISVISWDANFRENSHCLDFFYHQNFPRKDYEFIWVDYFGSNDTFRRKINNFDNFKLLPLKNSPKKPWHLGECINAGAAAASGEIFVFPDGDIVVDPYFLSYIWDTQSCSNNLALYFFRYDEPYGAPEGQNKFSLDYLKSHSQLNNSANYAGCLSIKRNNFINIKGFEIHRAFSGPGAIALEAYTRIKNSGMSVKWASKNIYHPWHPNSGNSNQNARYALRLAKQNYDWIIPYAGLEQSWIIHCRSKNREYLADTHRCDKFLSSMPKIDLNFYIKLFDKLQSRQCVAFFDTLEDRLNEAINIIQKIEIDKEKSICIQLKIMHALDKLNYINSYVKKISAEMLINELRLGFIKIDFIKNKFNFFRRFKNIFNLKLSKFFDVIF